MFVTVEIFLRSPNNLLETATDRTDNEHPMWVVAAPFRVLRYISDETYLRGDWTLESASLLKVRIDYVKFQQTCSPDSYVAFQSHGLLAAKAINGFKFKEELYVNYGNAYDFAHKQCRRVSDRLLEAKLPLAFFEEFSSNKNMQL